MAPWFGRKEEPEPGDEEIKPPGREPSSPPAARAEPVPVVSAARQLHRRNKLWLWVIWCIAMCLSVVYCVISVLTFENIYHVHIRISGEKASNSAWTSAEKDNLWSVLAATFLAPAGVIGFFFFGGVLLFFKSWAESGITFSYGVLHFSALWLALVVLQSSVMLHGFRSAMVGWEERTESAELSWVANDTRMAVAQYVFGYILSFVYVGLFGALFFFRHAMVELLEPKVQGAEEDKAGGEDGPVVPTDKTEGYSKRTEVEDETVVLHPVPEEGSKGADGGAKVRLVPSGLYTGDSTSKSKGKKESKKAAGAGAGEGEDAGKGAPLV